MEAVANFLCCSKPRSEVVVVPEDGGDLTLPLDTEGFVICPAHGMRRYGWRSMPTKSHVTTPASSTQPAQTLQRPDYSFAGNDGPLRADQKWAREFLAA